MCDNQLISKMQGASIKVYSIISFFNDTVKYWSKVNSYKFLCRNIKEWKKLEDLGVDGSIILKYSLTKQDEGARAKFYSG